MKCWPLLLLVSISALAAAAENEPAPAPPVSASFDCSAAKSAVERMICADAELADRDRRLGLLFAELQKEAPQDKRSVRDAQRAWLKQRDACGDSSCIASVYDARIADLLSAMPSLGSKVPMRAPAAESLMAVFAGMTPEDLQRVTTSANRQALGEASCRYFERSPRAAAELFRAYFGSTRDGYQPLCGRIDVVETVPAVKAYVDALEQASAPGQCFGTLMHSLFRSQQLVRIMAVVDADPDIAGYERAVAHRYDRMNYQPDLAHWAQQGLWQKHIFAEVQRTQPLARDALSKFYASRFGLGDEKAGRVAEYYVQQLMDVYVRDHAGFSSTLSYASLCLGKDDLERYLGDGMLPAKECPYHEFADTSEAQTLRRLLGLAIVDDYPPDVVKRLIKAGAALEVPKARNGEETPESPLMMAAARTDVIEALLAAGADPNKGNGFGKTPLMYAVAERNLSGVQALLRAGAEVDAATAAADPYCTNLKAGGRTALMYAAWHGNEQIVRVLLDAHADPGAKDSNGDIAADYAARNRDVDGGQRERIRAALQTKRSAFSSPAAN